MSKKIEWSAGDDQASQEDHWLVSWNTDLKTYEIQRFDYDPGLFESDSGALWYVFSKAKSGSKLHRKAIDYILQESTK